MPFIFAAMPKRKNKGYSHGFPKSPTKELRAKKALFEVNEGLSISKAAQKYDISFSYLQRRVSGTVEVTARNGPAPILREEEENTIVDYLKEMALRGMGLGPSDVMDLVQNFLQKEKRNNPFKDNRPGYKWYYGFMARHKDLIETRQETLLDYCRSKVTKEKMDNWFVGYNEFLSNLELLDKPHRVWNADETGFSMGSKAGKVIGPTKATHPNAIPHVSGGSVKQRLTVMYCASGDGTLIPPQLVYPEPKPTAYDPLINATRGTVIEYSPKGWMNTAIFSSFLDHFDKYAGEERPVVLLIESVSSHINMDLFTKAKSMGIELYRLVPNATHLMQPLDNGVFGLLKKEWQITVKRHTKESPGESIGKKNFASKLAETQMRFFAPYKIVSSFKKTGIFPINRSAISNDLLKPSNTFQLESPSKEEVNVDQTEKRAPNVIADAAAEALRVYREVLDTPYKTKYDERIQEGYDVQGSPGFIVYKRLHERAMETTETQPISTLEVEHTPPGPSCTSIKPVDMSTPMEISPVLKELTTMPKAQPRKDRPDRVQDILPDSLTSEKSIRTLAIAELKTAQEKAEKERIAKAKYVVRVAKKPNRRKQMAAKGKGKKKRLSSEENICPGCLGSFEEEERDGIISQWVQCDQCSRWMHRDCIPINFSFNSDAFLVDSDIEFICHICSIDS